MKKVIGVVGLGRMGQAIAGRLLAQGYRIIVYNRSIARAEPLTRLGAEVAATPRELASASGIILSSLTDEDALLDVCTGPSGMLSALRAGIHLSLSTLSPAAALRLAALHDEVGATYLSVPVQGIVQGLCSEDDPAKGSDVSVSSKDLRLLVADGASLPMPLTRTLMETFGAAEANGWGHLDPVAVRRVICLDRWETRT